MRRSGGLLVAAWVCVAMTALLYVLLFAFWFYVDRRLSAINLWAVAIYERAVAGGLDIPPPPTGGFNEQFQEDRVQPASGRGGEK